MHALKHPVYGEPYQRSRKPFGRQRRAKVAQIDIARTLTEATWHMRTNNRPFAPASEAPPLVSRPDGPQSNCAPEASLQMSPGPPTEKAREMSAAPHPPRARP
jgi:hypothetical protein